MSKGFLLLMRLKILLHLSLTTRRCPCGLRRRHFYRDGDTVTFNYFVVNFVILPNYRMINYDSIFILSSGVTCNWCIQLDAPQSLAFNHCRPLSLGPIW